MIVTLDTNLTPSLIEEGIANELIHSINRLRKQLKFNIQDKINIDISGDTHINRVAARFKDKICSETLATYKTGGKPYSIDIGVYDEGITQTKKVSIALIREVE